MEPRRLHLTRVLALCMLLATIAVSEGQISRSELIDDWSPNLRAPDEGTDRFLLVSQPIYCCLGDGVTLPMVQIPAGRFLMGSLETEAMRSDDEGPLHEVEITRSFQMSQFEITREVWGKVMGWVRPIHGHRSWPATRVDFDDCKRFCNRLSDLLGLQRCYSGSGRNIVCDFSANGFRLPTEAEWEYACRAGTSSAYCCGDEAYGECEPGDGAYLECVGWFLNNAKDRIHPVGEKGPNAFGLHDMHGNAWEWCWDFYSPEHYSSSDLSDPLGPEAGANRVVRGGAYSSNREDCRSARRAWVWPNSMSKVLGFRVVRVPD